MKVKGTKSSTSEAVDASSLAAFKARLDGAVSNPIEWEVSLPIARELEPDDLKGPFQPNPFYDSITLLLLLFYYSITITYYDS